jgi:hypothetical protein
MREDRIREIRLFESPIGIACSAEQPGRIWSGARFTERSLHLRREHKQLASRLHDDLPYVTARRRDNLHRLTLSRPTNLVSQPSQLVRLRDPCVAADAVLLDEIGNRCSSRRIRLQLVRIRHLAV